MKTYDHSAFYSLTEEEKELYLKNYAEALKQERAADELQLVINEIAYRVQHGDIDIKLLSKKTNIEMNSIDDLDKFAQSEDLLKFFRITQALDLTVHIVGRRGINLIETRKRTASC